MRLLIKTGLALASALMLSLPVRAQGMPDMSPPLKKMLGSLPIAGLKDQVNGMVADLKKTDCGGGLTGCYMTSKTLTVPDVGQLPVQLYFFTSKNAQQTAFLVVNRKVTMPSLLKANVQKLLAGSSLSDPIFSISTTDFSLDTNGMPAELRNVIKRSYFDVNEVNFSSGVQFMGRASIGGLMQKVIEKMWHVPVDAFVLKGAVVLPIPTDLASGAGTGVGLAQSLADGDTMSKSVKQAGLPEAYVEFQLAPGQTIRNPMGMLGVTLTDATLYLNNMLILGYQGNINLDMVKNKTIITFFKTPITPVGLMDLGDFEFGLAMPKTFTLEDYAYISLSFATPVAPGGGFIKGINLIKQPLLMASKPLSVFQLTNPMPPAPYKYGDRTKPFPSLDKFNLMLLGPMVQGGPLLKVASNVRILGLTMGGMGVEVGGNGFNGEVTADVRLRMGPLGKTGFKMTAKANITEKQQLVKLKGNALGRVLELILDGNELTMDSPATCLTPFEIKAKATIAEEMNVESLLDLQGGANVDPAKLQNCVGKDLEAAYKWVASTGKDLPGYTAKAANEALNTIANTATKEYNRVKDGARDAANKTSNGAMHAFNDAGNAFKKIGKKKKHKKGPDPKFAASVFDWDYYYDHAPDVVNAKADLATHWKESGFNEGRQGSPEFNVRYYRSRYLDVQQACGANDLACILQHWLDHGIEQGRQGSAEVAIASYLKRYPDLQQAFGLDNYEDAMDHWLNNGGDEGRDSRPESPSNGPLAGTVQAGGDGGGAWSDVAICGDSYLTGFRLRYGDDIDAVQFGYNNRGWAPRQGAGGGWRTEVLLSGGEYFSQVEYSSGNSLDSITFRTNLGRTFGPYGKNKNPRIYNASPGEKIGCMSGRAGKEIDRLMITSTGLR